MDDRNVNHKQTLYYKNLPPIKEHQTFLLSRWQRTEMWTTNTSSSQSVDGNFSNISSHDQLCIGSYSTILDILMLVVNLPIALYVVVELFLKQCATPSSPGNSPSSSQNELLFLHLACSHFIYYIRVLLNIIQNLGGVTGIGQEYITAFHSCSLIGGSLFFAGMSIDLYVAVAHPVAYVNQKASTKQIHARIFCTFVWMYSVTIGIVTVICNIKMYHPLTMASFCAAVPVSFIFCVVILFILHPAGSGKGSQTSRPDKIKQAAIRFILNSLIILSIYFLPHICVLIYLSVKKADWLHLPCQVLPLILTVQISEFVTPLIFFHNTGKLGVIAKHCLTICRNIGSWSRTVKVSSTFCES